MIIELTNTELTLNVSTLLGTTSVLQAQFGSIDVSGNVAISKAYVDASIVKFATNASVNTTLGAYLTNASVNAVFLLRDTSALSYTTNASVNTAFYTYGIATNASINSALGYYSTNVSVNTYNTSFKSYVDGSLLIRDASTQDVVDGLTLFYSKSQIDSSFYTKTQIDSSQSNVTHLYLVGVGNYIVGLKNASGNNGDEFVYNTSLYEKIGGVWYQSACTSVNFG